MTYNNNTMPPALFYRGQGIRIDKQKPHWRCYRWALCCQCQAQTSASRREAIS